MVLGHRLDSISKVFFNLADSVKDLREEREMKESVREDKCDRICSFKSLFYINGEERYFSTLWIKQGNI